MKPDAGKALYFREGVDLAQFHHKVWPRVNIRVSGHIQGAAARHILSILIQHLRASHTSHTK